MKKGDIIKCIGFIEKTKRGELTLSAKKIQLQCIYFDFFEFVILIFFFLAMCFYPLQQDYQGLFFFFYYFIVKLMYLFCLCSKDKNLLIKKRYIDLLTNDNILQK